MRPQSDTQAEVVGAALTRSALLLALAGIVCMWTPSGRSALRAASGRLLAAQLSTAVFAKTGPGTWNWTGKAVETAIAVVYRPRDVTIRTTWWSHLLGALMVSVEAATVSTASLTRNERTAFQSTMPGIAEECTWRLGLQPAVMSHVGRLPGTALSAMLFIGGHVVLPANLARPLVQAPNWRLVTGSLVLSSARGFAGVPYVYLVAAHNLMNLQAVEGETQ